LTYPGMTSSGVRELEQLELLALAILAACDFPDEGG
jgi:hypothetical protein